MDQTLDMTLTAYQEQLAQLGIRVQKLIMFGSYAQGTATPESDLDLAVLSDDFAGMDVWSKLSLLGRARLGLAKPMEIMGLTAAEFQAAASGTFIADEIRTKGKVVFEAAS